MNVHKIKFSFINFSMKYVFMVLYFVLKILYILF